MVTSTGSSKPVTHSGTSASSATYCPDVGEIIYLDFDPQAGHEQAHKRPALVLSPQDYNRKTSLCVVCPITNQAKGHPFEVAIPQGEKATGVVLADHVKSLDWRARHATFHSKPVPAVIAEVRGKLKAFLNIK